MLKILIFKTSADYTMMRLLDEIKGNRVDCLIQTSQLNRYESLYPNIHFIDIESEGFYDINPQILNPLKKEYFDRIYITFTGVVAHNYGNVLEVVRNFKYEKLFFYNCNGDSKEAPDYSRFAEKIIFLYVLATRYVIRIINKLRKIRNFEG